MVRSAVVAAAVSGCMDPQGVEESDASLARTNQPTIVVAGGSTGGIAAAIEASRLGVHVLLVDPTGYLGGQASAGGVSALDEYTPVIQNKLGGLYREFIDRLFVLYGDRPLKTCQGGYNTCVEPSAARQVFEEMLDDAGVEVLLPSTVVAVNVSHDAVQSVQIRDEATGAVRTVTTQVVIDATETGDLLPLAGERFRLGNTTSDDPNPMAHVQNITWAAIIERDPDVLLPPTTPLSTYDDEAPRFRVRLPLVTYPGPDIPAVDDELAWDFARHARYRGSPNRSDPTYYDWTQEELISKTSLVHTNEYPETLTGPGRAGSIGLLRADHLLDPDDGRRIGCEAQRRTLNFLHYLRTELQHPDWHLSVVEGYQTPYNDANLCDDSIIPESHKLFERQLAPIPYTREGRRAFGEYTWTGAEYSRIGPDILEPNQPTAAVRFDTSIAIGVIPPDLYHGCDSNRCLELSLESVHDKAPGLQLGGYQVPLDALIPERVDGLVLANLNLVASRLVMGGHRTQHATMASGQAAGALGALAALRNQAPRTIHPIDVQRILLDENSTLSLWWFSDVADPFADIDPVPEPNPQPESPYWKDVQLVSLREVMRGSEHLFRVNHPLPRFVMARVLTNLFSLPLDPVCHGLFEDVDESTFCDSVEAVFNAGLVDPVGPGVFGAHETATGGVVLTAFSRGFGASDPIELDTPVAPGALTYGAAATLFAGVLGRVPTAPLVETLRWVPDGEIHASWPRSHSTDGIAEYRVAVGTTPGGTELTGDWLSVGLDRSFTGDFALDPGVPVWVSVQAISEVGVFSKVGISRSVTLDVDSPHYVDLSPRWLDGQVRFVSGAFDDAGIHGVDFQVDGGPVLHGGVADAIGDSALFYDHPTDELQGGSHTVTATASDAAGNVASCEVSFQTPTTVLVSSPPSCGLVSENVVVAAETDPRVTEVAFWADEALIGVDDSPPFAVPWTGQAASVTFVASATGPGLPPQAHGVIATVDGNPPVIDAVVLQGAPGTARDVVVDVSDDRGMRVVELYSRPTNPTVFITPVAAAVPAGDELVLADLDGDHHADLVSHHPGASAVTARLWTGHGYPGSVHTTVQIPACGGSGTGVLSGSGDFDRDGRTDLVWWDPATDQVQIELLNRTTCLGTTVVMDGPALVGVGWRLAGVGDLSGDGYPDLLWHRFAAPLDEDVVVWVTAPMPGGGVAVQVPVASPITTDHTDWEIAAVADVEGDGTADIVWYSVADGHAVAWLMDRGVFRSALTLHAASQPHGLDLVGLGELNADPTTPELLWRDPATGGLSRWVMPLPRKVHIDFDPPWMFRAIATSGSTLTVRAIDLVGQSDEAEVVVP